MDAAWEDAIKRGNVQVVLNLLGRGADVDARDRYGQTGIMLAAHAGHREVVEILIAHRANLNITAKFGLSALMLALVAGHAEVARVLAKAGAGPISHCREPVPQDSLARRLMIWLWRAACWSCLQN
jgi:ankyrin repeat protein